MTKVGLWLATLGGGRPDVMVDVPESRGRYKAIGGVLVATAAIAAVSGGYAFYRALAMPVPFAVVLGLAWGFVILTLDRALVQTMSNQKSVIKNVLMVLPRLAIAIVLGVVISTPLVLQIFQKEIDAQIAVMDQQEADQFAADQQAGTQADEVAALESQVGQLKATIAKPKDIDPSRDAEVKATQAQVDAAQSELDTARKAASGTSIDPSGDPRVKEAQAQVDRAQKDYDTKAAKAQCELDGTCGTKHAGDGDAYRAAKALAEEAKKVLDDANEALGKAKASAESSQAATAERSQGEADKRFAAAKTALATAQAALRDATSAAQADQEKAYADRIASSQRSLAEIQPTLDAKRAYLDTLRGAHDETLANSHGMMKSLQALAILADEHPIIAEARMWLELLFIFIEIMPVLTKAMMNIFSKFAYDDVLEARDNAVRDAARAKAQVDADRAEADAEFAKSAHEDLLNRQRDTVKMVNDEVIAVQRELISESLQAWKRQTRAAGGAAQGGPPVPGGVGPRPQWQAASSSGDPFATAGVTVH